jgi:hypothetical protein
LIGTIKEQRMRRNAMITGTGEAMCKYLANQGLDRRARRRTTNPYLVSVARSFSCSILTFSGSPLAMKFDTYLAGTSKSEDAGTVAIITSESSEFIAPKSETLKERLMRN